MTSAASLQRFPHDDAGQRAHCWMDTTASDPALRHTLNWGFSPKLARPPRGNTIFFRRLPCRLPPPTVRQRMAGNAPDSPPCRNQLYLHRTLIKNGSNGTFSSE